MLRRPRRSTSRVLPIAMLLAVAMVAACGDSLGSPTPPPTTPPSSVVSPGLPTAEPSLDASPGATDATPAPEIGQTDTDTEIGRIWDALPPGFPEYPGSVPTETGEGPVSGQFSVQADVATVTTFLQGGLETAGFSTESLSGPLEDGSMEIVSIGPDSADCRVRTSIAPAGGTTLVTVLYGSSCPMG
jgi:hypothetical protein